MADQDTATPSTLLMKAISDGNKAEILQLLFEEQNVDVGTIDAFGNTVLHLALQNNTSSESQIIEILHIFINRGADPNIKNINQQTVLHLAIARRKREIVDYLLQHGGKIDDTDDKGNSALHFFIEKLAENYITTAQPCRNDAPVRKIEVAEERESADFVEWLLSKGYNCDSRNTEGESALHLTIKLNLQHILPCQLKGTKDIDFVSESDDETLLQLFLKANHCSRDDFGAKRQSRETIKDKVPSEAFSRRYDIDIVRILLDRGVSVDHQNSQGLTALHLAVSAAKTTEDMDIVKVLFDGFTKFEGQCGNSLLSAVVKKAKFKEAYTDCYLQMLSTLISKGKGTLNSKNGWSAVYDAFFYNSVHAIEMMRRNNVNFNVITDDGNNLLHAISDNKFGDNIDYRVNLIDFLVGQGCDVNLQNGEGRTPLHVALHIFYENDIILNLLANGANVDCQDSSGYSPLHLSIQYKMLGVMRALLESSTNVNSNSPHGRPIHKAAISSRTSILTMLLRDRAAEVNARNFHGDTALTGAIIRNCLSNVHELLAYGADINDAFVMRLINARIYNDAYAYLLYHCLKLKAANMPYSGQYEPLLTRINADMYERYLAELESLKNTYVDMNLSLYQWLRMNSYERSLYSEDLRTFVTSPALTRRFPQYSTVILNRYYESVARRSLLAPAKQALTQLIRIDLPDFCLDCILIHLNTGYMLEIIELAVETHE